MFSRTPRFFGCPFSSLFRNRRRIVTSLSSLERINLSASVQHDVSAAPAPAAYQRLQENVLLLPGVPEEEEHFLEDVPGAHSPSRPPPSTDGGGLPRLAPTASTSGVCQPALSATTTTRPVLRGVTTHTPELLRRWRGRTEGTVRGGDQGGSLKTEPKKTLYIQPQCPACQRVVFFCLTFGLTNDHINIQRGDVCQTWDELRSVLATHWHPDGYIAECGEWPAFPMLAPVSPEAQHAARMRNWEILAAEKVRSEGLVGGSRSGRSFLLFQRKG